MLREKELLFLEARGRIATLKLFLTRRGFNALLLNFLPEFVIA